MSQPAFDSFRALTIQLKSDKIILSDIDPLAQNVLQKKRPGVEHTEELTGKRAFKVTLVGETGSTHVLLTAVVVKHNKPVGGGDEESDVGSAKRPEVVVELIRGRIADSDSFVSAEEIVQQLRDPASRKNPNLAALSVPVTDMPTEYRAVLAFNSLAATGDHAATQVVKLVALRARMTEIRAKGPGDARSPREVWDQELKSKSILEVTRFVDQHGRAYILGLLKEFLTTDHSKGDPTQRQAKEAMHLRLWKISTDLSGQHNGFRDWLKTIPRPGATEDPAITQPIGVTGGLHISFGSILAKLGASSPLAVSAGFKQLGEAGPHMGKKAGGDPDDMAALQTIVSILTDYDDHGSKIQPGSKLTKKQFSVLSNMKRKDQIALRERVQARLDEAQAEAKRRSKNSGNG